MKNFLTFLTPIFIMVFTIKGVSLNNNASTISSNRNLLEASNLNQHKNYVSKYSFEELFPWMITSASKSEGILAACPSSISADAGPGECSAAIEWDFDLDPLSDPPGPVYGCGSSAPSTIVSSVYCPIGQTKYRRNYTHSGPTDLNLTSVRLGVFQSSGSPSVTINVYLGLVLASSTTQIIPSISSNYHNFALTPTLIPASTSYAIEVVADAPWVSVFKIGRNAAGGGEAIITSTSCTALTLNTEGSVSGNAVDFCPIGTLLDYKIIDLNNSGFESGDEFPIGETELHYSVINANGRVILDCEFSAIVEGFTPASGAIACQDNVQVSVGDDCTALVTPEMLLKGDNYGCYDLYTVTIKGKNGQTIGNTLNSTHIGQTLETTITGPNGNKCWGRIKIEDKYGPKLVCDTIYATCSTNLTPGSPISDRVPVSAIIQNGEIGGEGATKKSFVIPVNYLPDSEITDLNVFLDITHGRVADLAATLTAPNGTSITLFNFASSDCDGSDMIVTLDDEATMDIEDECEGTSPSIAGLFQSQDLISTFDGYDVEGDWVITIYDIAPGEGGNVNQLDLIFSQDGGEIPLPMDDITAFSQVDNNTFLVNSKTECSEATLSYTDEVVESDCASVYSKIIKRCWTGLDKIGNVAKPCCQLIYVYRNGLSTLVFPPNYDGVDNIHFPLSCRIFGDSIPPVSVTGVPTGDLCTNVQFVTPTDVVIDICENSYKIIRTHKVIEWCSGDVIVHNQIIKVIDNEGPELKCPANITVSTDAYACTATYKAKLPEIVFECSSTLDYHLSFTTNEDFLNDDKNEDEIFTDEGVNQTDFTISALPEGVSYIKWEVTDDCGNSSSCIYNVTARDLVLPTAQCDRTTVASIGGNGFAVVDAFTFNDGSRDNCGILKYEARKMVDICKFNTAFGPTVEFCCAETNTTIMVEFKVTDLSGNTNVCMVEVLVQDKLPPYITECPKDITLDCQADYNDTIVTGVPKVVDNCKVVSVKKVDDLKINQCGEGTVTRTWTVEDNRGFTNSCVQVITLFNDDKFYYNIENEFDPRNDIKWPSDYSTAKCFSVLTPESLPVGFNRPILRDDNCSLATAIYKDQVFKIKDGSCEKVLRTWTVIDWCTYNDRNPVYGEGWYQKTQIIKIQNDIAPSFELACVDRTFPSYGACKEVINFTMTAVDDCPEGNVDLNWEYELYLNSGNTIDSTGTTANFNRILKNGTHKIRWIVEDKCGNRAFCNQTIFVVERKKPTPYCITSLSTAVMNSNGKVSIWAKDFDKGAFDNCTHKDSLEFTFFGARPVRSKLYEEHYFTGNGIESTKAAYENGTAQIWLPKIKSSGLTFKCSDIPNGISQQVKLDVFVTDLAGNSDYCSVNINLQDNSDFCPNSTTGLFVITGKVLSNNGSTLNNVEIKMESNVSEHNKSVFTNTEGGYAFNGLKPSSNYTLSAYNDKDILNGVSTLDLVMIQRHILGVEQLNDPNKIIAADADNSQKITISDLVVLRKAILGVENKFSNSQTSWRFITTNQTFANPSLPFPFSEKYIFNNLNEFKTNQNFTPIKIGDVNNSVTYRIGSQILEPRSSKTLSLYTENKATKPNIGDEIIVPVYSSGFDGLLGYQMTMQFNPEDVEFLEVMPSTYGINEDFFGLNRTSEGLISTSWNSNKAVDFKANEPIFNLKFKVKDASVDVRRLITLNSKITEIQGYDEDKNILNITISSRSKNSFDPGFVLKQNVPNPFQDATSISFDLPVDGNVNIQIMDINGNLVKTIQNQFTKGTHQISLDKSMLGKSGIYIYQVESGAYKATKRMILID